MDIAGFSAFEKASQKPGRRSRGRPDCRAPTGGANDRASGRPDRCTRTAADGCISGNFGRGAILGRGAMGFRHRPACSDITVSDGPAYF